jgi:serine protease Do
VQIGQLISIAGPAPVPVAAGVVSVGRRTLPARTGILGVQLEDAPSGPRVAAVVANSGAAKAGIKVNDIIVSVSGVKTRNRDELTREVQKHPVGTTVSVTVLRDEKEIESKATVGNRPPTTQQAIIDTLNGPVNARRDGFPDVFLHDAIIEPGECGTPVVDISGKAIGMNIARSGRTESLAIHATVLKRLIGEMVKTK